jgi:cellulose synthase (UDP-forming)
LTIDVSPILQILGPTLFIIGVVYLLGPLLPLHKTWARVLVFAAVWLTVARYLEWRVVETVLPARGAWYQISWIWLCFGIELLAIADQLQLYLIFLRYTDRRKDADAHERRLRQQPAAKLPSVDVFIPTYNEPIEVLEKTIVGALCLDYPNFYVWVLDDGRRSWLKDFCEAKGAGYLIRPDNSHAKAGNINHALAHTSGEFVATFDADFVPQRNFLIRMIGFFSDPSVGIVQCPHAFYNHDPLQTNLAMHKAIPDEQRFFFDAIMPSRDGWDAAFCCGSNSVIRRAALTSIGSALPTASITEDMLLTLTLLRQGYVTRYLCERLAFGLAPENVDAFFVQRQRWARGAIQILYLSGGPLGGHLGLMQRLLFLPNHWLTVGLQSLLAALVPILFLWFGLSPVAKVSALQIVYYMFPAILAILGGMTVYAPGTLFPLATQVLGLLQSFKILPTVLLTLIRPRGHAFRVTPKGPDVRRSGYARGIFWSVAALMALTVIGLVLNALPEWRSADAAMLPIVGFWAVNNVVVFFLTCMMMLQGPARRDEERFEFDEPIWIFDQAGMKSTGRVKDMSLSGVAILTDEISAESGGEQVSLFISDVGLVRGRVVRATGEFRVIAFERLPSLERDLLIRKLFTSGHDTASVHVSTWSATGTMLMSIWATRSELPEREAGPADQSETQATPPLRSAEPSNTVSNVIPPRVRPRISELAERRHAVNA